MLSFTRPKGHPTANKHDKSITRGRAGAGSLWGFPMCSRGLAYVRGVKVSAMLTNKIKIWLVRGYARVTPPPLHLLCKPDIFFLLFRLSIWLICEPLGRTPPPKEKPPAGRTSKGAIHVTLRTIGGNRGTGVCIGFTPAGLGPMVASFSAFVNTFFSFLVIF